MVRRSRQSSVPRNNQIIDIFSRDIVGGEVWEEDLQTMQVYEAAKASHPERWNGRQTWDESDIEVVYPNPDKTYEETTVAIVKDPEVKAS